MARTFLPILTCLVLMGCGLDPLADIGDSGDSRPGQNGDDDQACPGSDPSDDISAIDRIYLIDLKEAVVTTPNILTDLLGQLPGDKDHLLMVVKDEDEDDLVIATTFADRMGTQHVCSEVQTLDADWCDNPEFETGSETVMFSLKQDGARPVPFVGMTFSGEFSWDASVIHDGMLVATLDARDLAGGFFDKTTSVCDDLNQSGSSCETCPDGSQNCLKVYVQVSPVEVDHAFDLNPDQSACP